MLVCDAEKHTEPPLKNSLLMQEETFAALESVTKAKQPIK